MLTAAKAAINSRIINTFNAFLNRLFGLISLRISKATIPINTPIGMIRKFMM